ncbi:MAG: hypothetical protein B7Z66_00005 [Chromatiales bacterium 21-64-14]|nr:MAG: hypothetical protein B7Z66_00005 [Chromatiales bacterium 21-64-14]HQU17411.1 TetR/AcrR family transcriptional regulator [Gammaproteobacteria bacterium]
MSRSSDKRERLVEAARTLIHRQGFRPTTLADIASESGVPLGNVYYYFKTKDELAAAVIEERGEEFRRQFDAWEQELQDPRQRIHRFIDLIHSYRDILTRHGCPIGSLCQELDKGRIALSDKADAVLRDQIAWITGQFRQMGAPGAEELGIYFVSTLQGMALVANALGDHTVVEQQTTRLRNWLDTL